MKYILLPLTLLLLAIWPVQADPANSYSATLTPIELASPSLRPIKDVPGLPRVLLIGDSVSMGYTLPVRADLAGKANVHRPHTNCGSSRNGVENIDAWLEDGHWDVIHFNWGLHDLKYLKPGDAQQNVPPQQYEQNLGELVARLQKTGAVLIFATTTPVPPVTKGEFRRVPTDVPIYNDIALKVMKENGVMIDDLYSVVLPRQAQIQNPNDVHYTHEGCEVLGNAVTKSILEALANRKSQPPATTDQPVPKT